MRLRGQAFELNLLNRALNLPDYWRPCSSRNNACSAAIGIEVEM